MQSVLQEWVMNLPLKMQSTMLLSLRGPDGMSKENDGKKILRILRSCVLVTAHPGKPDSFMGDQKTHPTVGDDVFVHFIEAHDEYPHHWLMHLIHAAEIVGQFHPDTDTAMWWYAFYAGMVAAFHMQPEGLENLQERLGAVKPEEEGWVAV